MLVLVAGQPGGSMISKTSSSATIGDQLVKKWREHYHSWCRTPKTEEKTITPKSTNKQILVLNSCFTYQKSTDNPMCSFFIQNSKSGLGIKTGHRQPECQRKPHLTSRANTAVVFNQCIQMCSKQILSEYPTLYHYINAASKHFTWKQ